MEVLVLDAIANYVLCTSQDVRACMVVYVLFIICVGKYIHGVNVVCLWVCMFHDGCLCLSCIFYWLMNVGPRGHMYVLRVRHWLPWECPVYSIGPFFCRHRDLYDMNDACLGYVLYTRRIHHRLSTRLCLFHVSMS